MVEAIVAACQPPAYLLTVAKAYLELENSREKHGCMESRSNGRAPGSTKEGPGAGPAPFGSLEHIAWAWYQRDVVFLVPRESGTTGSRRRPGRPASR